MSLGAPTTTAPLRWPAWQLAQVRATRVDPSAISAWTSAPTRPVAGSVRMPYDAAAAGEASAGSASRSCTG